MGRPARNAPWWSPPLMTAVLGVRTRPPSSPGRRPGGREHVNTSGPSTWSNPGRKHAPSVLADYVHRRRDRVGASPPPSVRDLAVCLVRLPVVNPSMDRPLPADVPSAQAFSRPRPKLVEDLGPRSLAEQRYEQDIRMWAATRRSGYRQPACTSAQLIKDRISRNEKTNCTRRTSRRAATANGGSKRHWALSRDRYWGTRCRWSNDATRPACRRLAGGAVGAHRPRPLRGQHRRSSTTSPSAAGEEEPSAVRRSSNLVRSGSCRSRLGRTAPQQASFEAAIPRISYARRSTDQRWFYTLMRSARSCSSELLRARVVRATSWPRTVGR